MIPKPNDQDRFLFIREFRVSLIWREDVAMFTAETQAGQATLGKTPRQALDELMKFTRRKSSPK